MKKYEIITKIKRVDDGELYTLNENGTYSLEMMKRDFPDSLHNEYSLARLMNSAFSIAESKIITID